MNKISLLFLGSVLFAIQACGPKAGNEEAATEEVTEEVVTEEVAEEAPVMNGLTEKEKADGWMMLFNGTSFDGWRGYRKDSVPSDWKIDDGSIYMAASGRGEAGSENGGDIIYDNKFSNFNLKLEWKLSDGGNSGIFYLGQESEDLDYIWKTAPEMQVLSPKHIDWNLGKDGNRRAGSLYDLYPANPQNVKPDGEWNQVEIIVYNGTVVHKQNGETVVEYHLWTPKWKEDVAKSKFPELNENWAEVAKEGYIGLQDHGDDVWFRNIKVKEL